MAKRLTKVQLRVIDILQRGGYIWKAAGYPYLTERDANGRLSTAALNRRVFDGLLKAYVLQLCDDGRYRVK